MNQALSIWDDLWQAYYGNNGFGSDTAEIYAYRLMPNCPTLNKSGETFNLINDEVKTNAANSLVALLKKFCRENECTCEVDGYLIEFWLSHIGTHFDHRCHVKIIRTMSIEEIEAENVPPECGGKGQKVKVVYIEKCIECPHFMQPSHCFKENCEVDDILSIPKWCPLRDDK
jgi:hypothetical protein